MMQPRLSTSRTNYLLSKSLAPLLMLAMGCAGRVPRPEPAGGHVEAPHLGWVIMTGDRENPDRDFVCQSNPRSECIIPVDRLDQRAMVHLHVYYHVAPTETTYTGSIRIGFFNAPHEINPNITVKPGEPPGNQSVSDFVSSTPGTYTMAIAVVATATPPGQSQNLREQVDIVVR